MREGADRTCVYDFTGEFDLIVGDACIKSRMEGDLSVYRWGRFAGLMTEFTHPAVMPVKRYIIGDVERRDLSFISMHPSSRVPKGSYVELGYWSLHKGGGEYRGFWTPMDPRLYELNVPVVPDFKNMKSSEELVDSLPQYMINKGYLSPAQMRALESQAIRGKMGAAIKLTSRMESISNKSS